MAGAQVVHPRQRARAQLLRAADRRDVRQALLARAARAGTMRPRADEAEQPHHVMLGREQLHVDRRALGAVLVVEGHELDVAPADAALRVHLLEQRERGVAKGDAHAGQRPADRCRLAEPDRRAIARGGRRRQRANPGQRGQAGAEQGGTSIHHGSSPRQSGCEASWPAVPAEAGPSLFVCCLLPALAAATSAAPPCAPARPTAPSSRRRAASR